jgi:hypothetical protein
MLPRLFFGVIITLFTLILPGLCTEDTSVGNGLDSLTKRLLQDPIHQPEVYNRAVQILESIESAPSCYRLATVSLIDTCQELESSVTAEVSLASIRETYAVRLAMCELASAGSNTPSQCEHFVPTAAACNSKSPPPKRLWTLRSQSSDLKSLGTTCYPDASPSHTRRCLSALNGTPQWWTSYSNALQNVLIVCQAGRNAIEKGERFPLLCVFHI